jgi:hypothetical protein
VCRIVLEVTRPWLSIRVTGVGFEPVSIRVRVTGLGFEPFPVCGFPTRDFAFARPYHMCGMA